MRKILKYFLCYIYKMSELTDEYIKGLVEKHKKMLQYNKDRYNNIRKNDPEFMQKNRDRARKHYEDNKEKKQQYYQQNKEIMNCKASYRYYKSRNKLDDFKTKQSDKYQKLVDCGFIESS